MAGLTWDLSFSLRQLLRRPGLSLAIVLTVAVGIGPNVAIFSVIKALVLEPLPYPEPDRLVQVWESDIRGRWNQPFSYPDYLDIEKQSSCFAELGTFSPRAFNIGGGSEPERVRGVAGTAGVLPVYGVEPALGRLFNATEVETAMPVVVLSDDLWKRRYQADPEILGQQILINGESFEVVGVMPEGFEFLSPWVLGTTTELWTPLVIAEERALARDSHWLLTVGRLKPDISWRAAEAELQTVAAGLREKYPDSNARTHVWVNPFLQQVIGGMTGQLLVLLGAVGLILLTACANITAMLLARASDRQTEVAIRTSLGASRKRVISQLLTESLTLSVIGGSIGVLLGYWSLGLLKGLIPAGVPRVAGIEMDLGVLYFSVILIIAAGIMFGLFPALTAARTNIVSVLREGSGSLAGSSKRNRLLRRLAVAQLAVAFMLTNGAILLFTSYKNVLQTPQVFDTDQVLCTRIALAGDRYEEEQVRVEFWERLIEHVDGLPGVNRAAVASKLPLEGGTNGSILVTGESFDPERKMKLVEFSYVSPGYFEAMGIPLLAGEIFKAGNLPDTEQIVIVNQALVDHYWPDQNPIGQQIRQGTADPKWSATVVGVVENVRQWGPEYRPLPEIYFHFSARPNTDSYLVVNAAVDPLTLIPSLRAEVLRLDANQPLSEARTMGQILTSAFYDRQLLLGLVSLFAVIALILALSGIFGIMSYNVAQRTREIGVRVAFGAARFHLMKMVLREALILVSFGAVTGVILIFLASGFIRSQLYGVGPLNLIYLVAGAFLMLLVAMLASGLPALRASRINAMEALRTD
jgi:predicted permease